jgi:RNA-directed DNA polymerase
MLKAVSRHTDLRWVVLCIGRWLVAPLQREDGTLVQRDRGTPQGSAISPLLANLFLHYAFDTWLTKEFPFVSFERYADDGVPRTQGGIDVEDRTQRAVLCQRWR